MMKLLYLILNIGLCFIGLQTVAQVSQGTHAVGLEIDWNSRNTENGRNHQIDNFRLTPSYSYFMKDELGIIVGASYHNRKNKNAYQNPNLQGLAYGFERKEADVFIGLRKYMEVQPKLFLMGTYGLKYHWNDTSTGQTFEGVESRSRQSARQFGFFGNLGLAYFPHEKFSFELIFIDTQFFRVYNKIRTYDSVDTTQYQGWSFDVDGFLGQPSLAVRYFF